MATDYTPTSQQVRRAYAKAFRDDWEADVPGFDRWLAKVEADAWARGLTDAHKKPAGAERLDVG